MFILAVDSTNSLKQLSPNKLLDGMPISVETNNARELFVWWESVNWIEDNNIIYRLNFPNENIGAFKKVFNKYVSSPSVPFGNPTDEEIGMFWLDSSMLSLYLASSFVVNGQKENRWIQLTNNIGGK